MNAFVEKFQPERYEAWLKGQDLGVDPKDPYEGFSYAPIPVNEVIEIAEEFPEVAPDFILKKAKKLPKRQLINDSIECDDDFIQNERLNESPTKLKKPKSKAVQNSTECTEWSSSSVNGHNGHSHNGTNGAIAQSSNGINFFLVNLTLANFLLLGNLQNACSYSLPLNLICGTSSSKVTMRQQNVVNTLIRLVLQQFGCENLYELSGRTLQYATHSPTAFEDETKFNFYSSLIEPYCLICLMLKPFAQKAKINESFATEWKPPITSRVLMPKSYYISKSKEVIDYGDDQLWNQSSLLVCSICKICVHAGKPFCCCFCFKTGISDIFVFSSVLRCHKRH